MKTRIFCFFILVGGFLGCRPDPGEIVIPDNYAPPYSEVSLLLIENYINRAFIDLQGREPLDVEMALEVSTLRADSLSLASRTDFIYRLQFDSTSRFGLPPYRDIFYRRIYERAKVDLLEGIPEADIQFDIAQLQQKAHEDSIREDWGGVAFAHTEIAKLQAILESSDQLLAGEIGVSEVYRRMI
ncbi:MAG: hypothetical protein AAFV07_10925, partial [Bacteroidota bacterium]